MTFLKQSLPGLHFNYTLLTVPDSPSRGVIEIRTRHGWFFFFFILMLKFPHSNLSYLQYETEGKMGGYNSTHEERKIHCSDVC